MKISVVFSIDEGDMQPEWIAERLIDMLFDNLYIGVSDPEDGFHIHNATIQGVMYEVKS